MNVRRIACLGFTAAMLAACGNSNSMSAVGADPRGSAMDEAGASPSGMAKPALDAIDASGSATPDATSPSGQNPTSTIADGGRVSTPSPPADGAILAADAGGASSDAPGASSDADVTSEASTPRDGGAARDGGGAGSTGALHVNGNVIDDGDGKLVVMRGPELVIRWGVYSGLTTAGVDVPWEGGSNNNVGSTTIREIGKTNASALRMYGGIGNELDGILNTAIVEQKMFVGVGRVDWTNAQMKATLDKYGKYVFIHPRGEFTYRDANQWRTDSLAVVKYIRGLGYKQAIEIGTTGYGQTWSTIQTYGQEVASSDPLKNTFFLLQLYSEYAKVIPQTLNEIAAFPYPVTVDACLFTSTYGNTPDTYKQVWDQSFAKSFSSFYWDWWGDGTGNSMTSSGTFASLDPIGQYIVNDSPAAMKNTVKTPFLLNAAVP